MQTGGAEGLFSRPREAPSTLAKREEPNRKNTVDATGLGRWVCGHRGWQELSPSWRGFGIFFWWEGLTLLGIENPWHLALEVGNVFTTVSALQDSSKAGSIFFQAQKYPCCLFKPLLGLRLNFSLLVNQMYKRL